MAKKKIKKAVQNTDGLFVFSPDKKKKLLGIFLCVFALLSLLSIISHSSYDQANVSNGISDFFKIFSSDPEIISRIESTHNWLGLVGAIISNFLITGTIGYFSFIFPIILFVWGYSILFNKGAKAALDISNFLLISALLIASLFGLLMHSSDFQFFLDYPELAGNVGIFIGSGISRLLGGFGGLIFLIAAIFTLMIIVFDIKISHWFSHILEQFNSPSENIDENISDDDQKTSSIAKIKLASKEKPRVRKRKIFKQPEDNINPDEEVEKPIETTIRIIRGENDSKNDLVELDSKEEELSAKKKKKDPLDKEITARKEADINEELPEQWEQKLEYSSPGMDLLDKTNDKEIVIPEFELKRNAELLKEKLALFDISIEDISVTPGPVVTLYEIVPSPGVKISRIVALEHDIALALAARGIRIIAPIPGKSAIGVEIPNAVASLVTANSVLTGLNKSKFQLPLVLGKTISGDIYSTNLADMPHLLIAGSTGSGKSVGLNMIITSLIFTKKPDEVKFILIDPKKIELSFYKKLAKHFLAVSPDLDEEIITSPQNALLALKSVEHEMEKRYTKLAKVGVRNIVDYNEKISDAKRKPKDTDEIKHYKLPYLIVIIDELADLMMISGKEVEAPIARLAQLARAVGIHLIVATQRPSVNVITGTIKANFSARIAYQVATKIDSRTILDMNGAEQLLGKGDMLFLPAGMPKPIRIQNAFISTEEIEKITNYIYVQKGFEKRYLLPSMFEKKSSEKGNFLSDLDPVFEDAARVIVRHQQGSVSLLQRRLKLGYSRAARIVDQLEEAGIVGPSEGSKARDVIIENEEQLERIFKTL